MYLKSTTSLFATALVALLGTTQIASANTPLDDNKVVRDSRGHVVHSIRHHTCVRTEWEAGVNVCAPAQPQRIVQAEPRRTLETAQKAVFFEFDSASLTPQARQQLDYIAGELQNADDVQRANIVGFADHIGTSPYNKDLSKRRAENVENYLNQRGYINTRVTDVRGLGEARSVTACEQETNREAKIECLQADRRVEVAVQYVNEQPTTAMIR